MEVKYTVFSYLDAYCERAGEAGLFAEPLNAVTNLFFILAAMLVARSIATLPREGWRARLDLALLVLSLFGIGLGSGLWHIHPNADTVLMDVIPITLFINIYLITALRRLFLLSWWKTLSWWGAYLVAGVVAQRLLPPGLLNGTIMYIPTYLTLGVMAVAMTRVDAANAKVLFKVLAVWTLSLIARTVDMQLCEQIQFGTHFLWHTLNAWVLWRLAMLLIENSSWNYKK